MRGEGVVELWDALARHRDHLETDGALEERRRANLAAEVFAVASARAKAHIEAAVAEDPELRRLLDAVQARELDPLTAVEEILEQVFRSVTAWTGPLSLTCRRPRAARRDRARHSRLLVRTPWRGSCGRPVSLKAENLQRTGRSRFAALSTRSPR